MTKSMLFFIAVLIVALGARPVLAGDEREFVDKTTLETFPNVGIIEMHDLCKAEFPGTHFCSTADIVRNGGLAVNLPEFIGAWVHPSRVIERPDGSSYDSVSGVATVATGNLSCSAWSTTTFDVRGMSLTSVATFTTVPCSVDLPVACCGTPVNLRQQDILILPPTPKNFPPITGPFD